MFTRQLLSAEEQHECCVGKRLENVPKNRYKTILPCTFFYVKFIAIKCIHDQRR